MKMKLEIQSIALLLMITGIATTPSCKKDKDENINTVKTKTELITMGSWLSTTF
jgi:hypothetical protein